MVFFWAVRKDALCSSCSAIPLATKLASRSGLAISTTLMKIAFPLTNFSSFFFNNSTASPLVPIMTPGRAVLKIISIRFFDLSISMRETYAGFNSLNKNVRIVASSLTRFPYSFSAYQRDSQSRMIPTRIPIGLTF
ncbi:hypothetical protein SDC9_143472 [bioreactor metagenome]|uniref:Uncharacterized protein n=1 Tax=bioreactor metagenome TaxID=1076179 RepID=A0A645E3E0_9ZZZZ